ncbi:9600_t:CDS:2, partial [Dentiscutata erythropus]
DCGSETINDFMCSGKLVVNAQDDKIFKFSYTLFPDEGKSTVSQMIQKYGIPIIDADLLAREVVQPNKPAYKLIVDHFSKEILLEDGTLDRAKLRSIIFSDETQRKILNKFTHPYIRREILKLVIWYWFTGKKA